MSQSDRIVLVEVEFLVQQFGEFKCSDRVGRFVNLWRVKSKTTKVGNDDHCSSADARFSREADFESPDTGVVVHTSGKHARKSRFDGIVGEALLAGDWTDTAIC